MIASTCISGKRELERALERDELERALERDELERDGES